MTRDETPAPARTLRGDLAAGTAVFAVAWLVRLAYLLQISRSPFFDFLQLDPKYYLDWARRIAAGDWLGAEVFEMSPLYSYLLAVFLAVAGEDLWLLRLLQIGAGALTCVLTWRLGCRLFDHRVGLLAGLGASVYGPFLFYEGQVMKEFLTPLLATGALLLLLRGRPDRPAGPRLGPIALAGALLALAALVRDNFLVLLAVLAGWLFLEGGRRLAAPAVLAGGALAVLLPVGARNAAVGGDFVLTTSGGGEVFYIGNGPYANGAYVPPPWVRSNPLFEHEDFRTKARELSGRELTRGEASRFWWAQGWKHVVANPGRTALLWMRKAALFWNDHELPDNYSFYTFRSFSGVLGHSLTFGPIAALAWAGLALARSDWRRLTPVLLTGAGYMLSVILFFNFARFRLPLVPILLVLAARALTGFWDAGRAAAGGARPRPGWVAALVLLIAAVPFVFIDWSSVAEEPFQDRLHLAAAYRQAGRPADAERVLQTAIADAEEVARRHGGDARGAATTPGGVTFVMALSAAHRDLGGALADQGRHLEAAAAYRRASDLSPKDAGILVALAAEQKRAGDPAGAARTLARAVQMEPNRFAAGFDLATLHYESDRFEDALAQLQRARRDAGDLGPLDRADFHYGMGSILLQIPGRRAEALGHLETGLRLNPAADQASVAREILEEARLSGEPLPPPAER